MSPPVAEDVHDSSESRNVQPAAAEAKDKAGDKKKSRLQTVSELKQQVLDCRPSVVDDARKCGPQSIANLNY
jgi:hypothetical protein